MIMIMIINLLCHAYDIFMTGCVLLVMSWQRRRLWCIGLCQCFIAKHLKQWHICIKNVI